MVNKGIIIINLISFPSQELFNLEVKYGIAFNQLNEKYQVDEVELEHGFRKASIT